MTKELRYFSSETEEMIMNYEQFKELGEILGKSEDEILEAWDEGSVLK